MHSPTIEAIIVAFGLAYACILLAAPVVLYLCQYFDPDS